MLQEEEDRDYQRSYFVIIIVMENSSQVSRLYTFYSVDVYYELIELINLVLLSITKIIVARFENKSSTSSRFEIYIPLSLEIHYAF